jgi:sporulation protein YlmC with PRC-barrel domain
LKKETVMKAITLLSAVCLLVLNINTVPAADPVKPAGYTRASMLQTLPVNSSRNESIGKASDLVVDLKAQNVAYVAIGVGGTVRPDRYVPIAFKDIGLSQDGKYYLYESTKEQLSAAAGFDNAWTVPSSVAGRDYGQNTAWRSSGLIGMAVQNESGETLGKIHDLVINLSDGKILYAALSHGGLAGVGDKLFAVPLDAMRMQSLTLKPNDHVFVIKGITRKQLDDAKGFEEKRWPGTADMTLFKAPVER